MEIGIYRTIFIRRDIVETALHPCISNSLRLAQFISVCCLCPIKAAAPNDLKHTKLHENLDYCDKFNLSRMALKAAQAWRQI